MVLSAKDLQGNGEVIRKRETREMTEGYINIAQVEFDEELETAAVAGAKPSS